MCQRLGSPGISSCAFAAYYEGHAYDSVAVQIAPIEGAPLGMATLASCDDTSGGGSPSPDAQIPVAELPGVSPDVAIVWRRDVNDTVLVRKELNRLPPEVRELLQAPACDPDDAPIALTGPWLAIVDGDRTEVDLLPPYQLDMLVLHASTLRYERAFLTIEVPEAAGRPLSHAAVETSLWQGGSISVRARCTRGSFVAQSVRASPPG